MMLFAFPEQARLAKAMGFEQGQWKWHHFPDGESYVRVTSDVKGKTVGILCSLNQPDAKILPLIFLTRALKELGAVKVVLTAPYLGYMRQDKQFHEGEAVTSDIFAALLSPYIDTLITIDPHLHRHHRMEEIYHCKCKVISAAPLMSRWIKQHVAKPLIIGPDTESERWVKEVATGAGAPYIVLEKIRHGDRNVEIMLPNIIQYHSHVPILVDDIISTAGTMLKTINLLRAQGFAEIICLATHGLFAGNAYNELRKTGTTHIITADTVPHLSNELEIGNLLSQALHCN